MIVGVLTTCHTQYTWYVLAPMDQEILQVFFYDVLCAVVMHYLLCLYYSMLTCYKQFGMN
jgi:hypothetical protein